MIVENPMLGRWVGPNITRGGLTKDYRPEDWVRIIRHGVKKDGTAASMPSRDYAWFSDQEVSDIAAYITSMPAITEPAPETKLGPLFAFLIAQGEIPLDAEHIDHNAKRRTHPPAITRGTELGEHLARTCAGCHGANFTGGPIPGGDPSWPPASNLTFAPSGLASWTEEDFITALREGRRPDGTAIDSAMPIAYTKNLEDAEILSIYDYLKALPPAKAGDPARL